MNARCMDLAGAIVILHGFAGVFGDFDFCR